MPNTVFAQLRDLLPDFQHVSVDYSAASSSDEILQITEQTARNLLSMTSGPLLIGGWSLGGLLALRLAIRGLADGLILFAATAKFTRPKEQREMGCADAYVRQMITGVREDRHVTEMKFRQLVFAETELMTNKDDLPLNGSWTTSALLAGLEVLRNVDCLPHLREVNCPAFIVHGTEDPICPFAAAEELLTLLPQAKLTAIPESGHVPFLGREVYLAESLRSWWNDQ
jgi:pimeloyl-[acyl-carrier protein] methyl ester esterase